jgi:hypothetical protein
MPPIAYGLLIRQAMMAEPVLASESDWDVTLWFRYLGMYAGEGSWEGLWLLLLPWLAVLLGTWQRSAYLVVFPCVLLLTFCNPLLCDFVAIHLTSYWTFFRVFWLLPVAAGLGTFLALWGRLAGQTLARWVPWPTELLAGLVILLGLAASWFLPGIYVWDAERNSMIGPGGAPRLAQNWLKMPPELIPIADTMLRDPDLQQVRVLCDDSIANYLTPCARSFRLVQPRALYTLPFAARAGRVAEGEKRYLVSLLQDGVIPGPIRDEDLDIRYYFGRLYLADAPQALSREQVEQLLDELRVKYVVVRVEAAAVSPNRREQVASKLREVGYRQVLVNAQFALWSRQPRTPMP